jgi:hypothetical protein
MSGLSVAEEGWGWREKVEVWFGEANMVDTWIVG